MLSLRSTFLAALDMDNKSVIGHNASVRDRKWKIDISRVMQRHLEEWSLEANKSIQIRIFYILTIYMLL